MKKSLDKVGTHHYQFRRWTPTAAKISMRQVITYLTPQDHQALKARAKAERRTMGAQLVYEALSFSSKSPAGSSKPKSKAAKA